MNKTPCHSGDPDRHSRASGNPWGSGQPPWTPASAGVTAKGEGSAPHTMDSVLPVTESALPIAALGALAYVALVRSGGRLRPLPAFPDSPYLLAGDDIVWLGGEGGIWHPRRILLANAQLAVRRGFRREFSAPVEQLRPTGRSALCKGLSSRLLVSVEGASVWQPAASPRLTAEQGVAACSRISANISAIGTPAGFGLLLAGAPLAFPLDRAPAKLRLLADSLASDDALAFASAALPLLGLGLGLTPSGDDLVGACLFARRLRGDTPAWQAAAENLTAAAAVRSNSISAALFGDLARGAAYAPLHDFAAAVGGGDAEFFAAARALCAIGHSSGWDMLTGFLLGAGGAISWKAAPGKAFQPITDFNGI